jgi:hypothetical protein
MQEHKNSHTCHHGCIYTCFSCVEDSCRGPCCVCLQAEDGSSMVVRNIGMLPHHYTVPQPRRQRTEFCLSFNFINKHSVRVLCDSSIDRYIDTAYLGEQVPSLTDTGLYIRKLYHTALC